MPRVADVEQGNLQTRGQFAQDIAVAGLLGGAKLFLQQKAKAEERQKQEEKLRMEAQRREDDRAFQMARYGLKKSAEGGYEPTELERARREAEVEYKRQGGLLAPLRAQAAEKELQLKETRLKQAQAGTAQERKAAGYAQRASRSVQEMDALREAGYDPTTAGAMAQRGAAGVPLVGGLLEAGGKGTGLITPETQRQEQAERNFVNAVLRRESGAAIAPHEFSSAEKQYFPRPGDSPEVLEQKRRNMEDTIAALEAESGPALQAIRERLTSREPGGLMKPKEGSVQDGYRFKGGDPADPDNWEKVK
jgi:hypothetical protein